MSEKPGMSLTVKVLLGLVLGLITGVIINLTLADNAFVDTWLVNGAFAMIGGMFINALKMLVVPLVFFSLICGVCGIGDIAALGRIGTKAFGLYVMTTAIAISTAILLAQVVGPGNGFEMENVEVAEVEASEAPPITDVFIDIIPSNPIQAMAEGEMLSIIFYAIVLGVSILLVGQRAKGVVAGSEVMNEIFMKMVSLVMSVAHIGVFCLIAKTFAEQGIGLLLPMASYFLTVLGALVIHMFVTILAILAIATRLNPMMFLRKMRSAQAFAFSTASSSATIPVTLRSVSERLGVNNSVASFTVPLGATINMDGTAIMQGVATVFIANVYGIELGIAGYATIIGMSVLASIGTAGVPGVGLIMLAMVLNQVGLPLEGIGIIMGVDRLLDMCRTAVNITGDAMVSTVVAKGENKLDESVYNDPEAGMFDTVDLHDAEAQDPAMPTPVADPARA